MDKYVGLVLLLAAIAVAIYVVSNSESLLQFKLPSFLKLERVSFFPPEPAPVKKTPTAAKPAVSPKQTAATSTTPQEGYVKISSFQLQKSYHPYIEVALSAYLNKGETKDITGWSIRGGYGEALIPQAQLIYSFGGASGDIILRSGQKVRIFSGPALKGNFRLNKCIGYLSDTSLVPALPKSCPAISRAATDALSSPCQKYISSLRTCQIPSANPPIPYDDFACRDFLSKLNYVGCVERHKNDSDFLKNEWYVWLGNQLSIFNPLYGKVQLVDKQRKVVSEYKY